LARAQLALDIVRERLAQTGVAASECRFDLIGVNALYGPTRSNETGEPYEVRVRVTARTLSRTDAVRVGNEVETLYTNGPAGGGGATKSVRDIIAVQSILLPRESVSPTYTLFET